MAHKQVADIGLIQVYQHFDVKSSYSVMQWSLVTYLQLKIS